ncbi:MAG: DNRLRE domain-containing protein [Candidatus Limnocylindrales bacterium]
MPASASRRGTTHAYHRGLSAVMVALALALLTALSLSPVYAAKPSSPPPSPGASPSPTSSPSPDNTHEPKPTHAPIPAPTATAAATTDPGSSDFPYADRVEAVITIAREQIGKPYRLGTEGPDQFDCSGLVYRAFMDAGEGNQIGARRMRAIGYERWFAARGLFTTNVMDAERGDLVMYNYGSHIGIYLGDGRVLSALTTGMAVHSLEGITLPVTGFLAVDWSGDRGPFVPGAVPPPQTDVPETPASLIEPITWTTAPSAELAAGPEIPGGERIDMRTANSRTFEAEDGSFTTEFFNRPVFYQPADSIEWLPIDLRFRESIEDEDGLSIADASPSSLILRSSHDEAGLLSLLSTGFSFGLDPVGDGHEEIIPTVIDGTYADYPDVLGKGAGMRILPRADGLKAFLVLSEKPKDSSFTFTTSALALDGLPLIYTAELDGSITLRDAAGTSYGRIMRPMLLDSSDLDGDGGGVRPTAVTVTSVLDEDGTQSLTFTADKSFLAEAVYPAFIDLTLVDFPTGASSAIHTFASSIHPDSNFSTYQRPEAPSYSEMWHGRRPGRIDDNEVYLRFQNVRETLAGVTVQSANLAAFPYWQAAGEDARATWVGRVITDWDVRSVTWNSKPGVDQVQTEVDTAQGQWSAMDVSYYATAIIYGHAPDYGLVLHATGEANDHWKRFVAETTAGAGALEPRLVVHWSGLRPAASLPVTIDNATTAATWVHSAVAPDAWRVQVQISADGFQTLFVDERLKKANAALTSLNVATTDLAPGTYSWRVRARYGEGVAWSEWSDPGAFVIAEPQKFEIFHPLPS